jgi:prolyl oligopeptidase
MSSALTCSVASLLVCSSLAVAGGCGGTDAPPPRATAAPASSPPPETTVAAAPSAAPSIPSPPATRRDDFHEVLHGVDIVDPYRWLEDQESQETRAWIDAENSYTHALLDARPERASIRARLEALSRVDSMGPPAHVGERYFLWRKRASDDLWTLYMRKRLDGPEEVLLDGHPLSPDHTTSVGLESVSKDGTLLVYSIRRGGEDETELRVKNVVTGADLGDQLPRGLYRDVALRIDKSGFYYVLQDRATGVRVRFHKLGTPIDRDTVVFGEGLGTGDWLGVTPSRNGRHVLFQTQHGWASNEVFVQDLARPGSITSVTKGLDAHFEAAFADDHLLMQTDLNAPNGRIVEVDRAHPSPEHWREIVPTGPDAIGDYSLIGGKLLVSYLHNATSRVVVYELNGKSVGEVALPGLGTASRFSGKWDSDEFFFSFTSYTLPYSVLRSTVTTRKVESWWQPSVPFASDDYETQQVWFTSKDGTRVPMFVVAKKGLSLDGDRPTLMTGYGGFDISQTPEFDPFAAWFVEHGGIFAMPNIRGGGEFGEPWHRAGMLEKKQNVFDDFIGAAQWLVANRYTRPERLSILGGSNGGLLVSAALTQRPDLFRAVVCLYPDLDMIGYHRFKNINPPALLEYGDASKPDEFKFLYAYSPYQKVTPGTHYPAVFLMTGDEDTRVPPLQARKMTARLQSTVSDRPVVLLYNTKSGHAGGEPVGKWLDDASLQLSFLAWQLGIHEEPAHDEAAHGTVSR